MRWLAWIHDQLGHAMLTLDGIQRWRHHVYEYSDDPRCILRAGVTRSTLERELVDGTVVRPGDPVVEVHFWNERVPRIGDTGPAVDWGARFYEQLLISQHELAKHLRDSPDLAGVVALVGRSSFARSSGISRQRKFVQRLGWEFVPGEPPRNWKAVEQFFQAFYVWLLVWSVNPRSLRGRSPFTAERAEIWISREALLGRYINQPASTVGRHLRSLAMEPSSERVTSRNPLPEPGMALNGSAL